MHGSCIRNRPCFLNDSSKNLVHQVFFCLSFSSHTELSFHSHLSLNNNEKWQNVSAAVTKFAYKQKITIHKTGVINDPLGQTHSHASSEHCFLLFCFSRFEKWGRTYVRTTCAKTMIPTGRDFGLAEWINMCLMQ